MAMTVLVGTWTRGLFSLSEAARKHEFAGRSVQGLTADGHGRALAIVDKKTLQRRSSSGDWSVLAAVEGELSCCVATSDAIYLGTDTARVLRLDAVQQLLLDLPGFHSVPGRETWVAGQALVDGRLVGPPLGVRSISATADGTLLANVHVGGIPRSTDGGVSWRPTLEIEHDVHEVRAHPTRPNIVAAAAAAGLCMSRDGGATFSLEGDNMHSRYCSAVAFVADEVWVAASDGPFASRARIYRRRIDEAGPLTPLSFGPSEWTDGIVDTNCIAARGSHVAFADGGGNLYLSANLGRDWTRAADGLGAPSSVLLV